MTPAPDPLSTISRTLAALPAVRVRPMFGAHAYFAGSVLFAFPVAGGLVLRLPAATREKLLGARQAREFLGPLPGGLSGWVIVPIDTVTMGLLESSHAMARGMARRTGRTGRTSRTSRTSRTGQEGT
jgi:hypothetical protein